MTRDPRHIVDPRKVRYRRQRLGLTNAVLAKATRVEAAVITRLENGHSQAGLTGGFLTDLCRVLAADLHELAPDRPDPDPPTDPQANDARRVGAILARTDEWTSVVGLATGLRWSLPRTLLALLTLEDVIVPTGQRLAWLGEHDVLLVGDAGDEDVLNSLTNDILADRGLSRLQAAILLRTHRGGQPWRNHGERIHGPRLVELGLIEQINESKGALTDTAYYNLCFEKRS